MSSSRSRCSATACSLSGPRTAIQKRSVTVLVSTSFTVGRFAPSPSSLRCLLIAEPGREREAVRAIGGELLGHPLGELRRAVVVQRERSLLVGRQAAAPHRDERLAVGLDDVDLRDAGLGRGLEDAVAGEDFVVLVDHDRPRGPDLFDGFEEEPRAALRPRAPIRRIRFEVRDRDGRFLRS